MADQFFILSEADLEDFAKQVQKATLTTVATALSAAPPVDSEEEAQALADFLQQHQGWMEERRIGKGVELLPDAEEMLTPALRKIAVDTLYAAREDNKVMDQAAVLVAANVVRLVHDADLVGSIRDVAIPSLAYCEEKYGHDDQARLNLEAAIGMSGPGYPPGPALAVRNQVIGYLRGVASTTASEAALWGDGTEPERAARLNRRAEELRAAADQLQQVKVEEGES